MVPKAEVAQEAVALVNIINMCDRFHTLPQAGGLYNQDSLFIYILHNYLIWENERAELDKAKQARNMPSPK